MRSRPPATLVRRGRIVAAATPSSSALPSSVQACRNSCSAFDLLPVTRSPSSKTWEIRPRAACSACFAVVDLLALAGQPPPEAPRADAERGHEAHEGQGRHPGPALRIAPRGEGRDAPIACPAARQQAGDALHEGGQGPTHRLARVAGTRPDRAGGSGDALW